MIDLDKAERMGIDAKRLKYPNAKSMEIVADELLSLVEEARVGRALHAAITAEEWALASEDPSLYHQHGSYYSLVKEKLAAYDAFLVKSEGGG